MSKEALITQEAVLEKRGYAQTCGYISGDPNYPLTCAGTSTCATGEIGFGCCDSLTCWVPGTCEGAGTSYCGGVGKANCPYSQIQQCTDNASPACITFYLSAGLGASITTPSWGCAATPTTFHAVRTSTGSATDDSSSLMTGGSESPGTGSGAAGAPTTAPVQSASTQPGNSGGGDSLTYPAEVGTIVGSVIGFLALIAVLVFGINQWRRHHTDDE